MFHFLVCLAIPIQPPPLVSPGNRENDDENNDDDGTPLWPLRRLINLQCAPIEQSKMRHCMETDSPAVPAPGAESTLAEPEQRSHP